MCTTNARTVSEMCTVFNYYYNNNDTQLNDLFYYFFLISEIYTNEF